MLDRLFANPSIIVASLLVFAILLGTYLVNRERSEIQRRKGPKRFRPDWGRTQAGDYRKKPGYRRKTGGGFHPQWPDRKRNGQPPVDTE